jgi:anthranilate phosphoribosyltransferase
MFCIFCTKQNIPTAGYGALIFRFFSAVLHIPHHSDLAGAVYIMDFNVEQNQKLGELITRLMTKNDLTWEEAFSAFQMILKDEVTDMQQGAFLAALTSKGETADEVAAGWQAVYDLDTRKVTLDDLEPVDNCGTGMDSFKTFNISTAAALVGAAGGINIARHGARAITSARGTVDMAESLGVDMECDVDTVARSIKECGIGLFNGMSPRVHPMALGRILSQIRFGSPLNIAASLANPALPRIAVRGVYSPDLLRPVAEVMRSIGYSDAIIIFGAIAESDKGMDEASVCGTSKAIHLQNDNFTEFSFDPEEFGLHIHKPETIAADKDHLKASLNMIRLLAGRGNTARSEAVILNSALLFYVKKTVASIGEGVEKAEEILLSGKALDQLGKWVEIQNENPAAGLRKLADLKTEAGVN